MTLQICGTGWGCQRIGPQPRVRRRGRMTSRIRGLILHLESLWRLQFVRFTQKLPWLGFELKQLGDHLHSSLHPENFIMCELSILRSLLSALSARVRIMTKRERRSARSGGGERRRPSSSNRSNELTASRGRSLRVLELAVDNETFLRSEKHFHKFSGHFTLVT